MKRFGSGLAVVLLLIIAYQFSQLRITPTIVLQAKQPLSPTVVPKTGQHIPVELAAVSWPSEPIKKPVVPKPKKKVQPQKRQPQKIAKKTEAGSSRPAGKTGEGFDVVGQFECSIDFYLKIMRQQGALVVAYENQHKRLISISPTEELSLLDRFPAGYSPLTRRITDDYPEAHRVLVQVAQRWGKGSYDILLVLPQSLELRIDQNLKRILDRRFPLPQITKVHVRYQRSGAHLVMFVERVSMQNKSFPIGSSIEI